MPTSAPRIALLLAALIGLWTACACAAAPAPTPAPADAALARQILDAAGVQGGLVVHVGCGDGRLTAALRACDAYTVHGLATDPAAVDAARRTIGALGLYGPVSIDRYDGRRLPYADNLASLVVIEDPAAAPMDEVLRVLAPNGVAYVKSKAGAWARTVKPRPADIDEWTHYLHDPDNNAVSRDAQVGPPRHLQWIGNPMWARHHDHMASMSALVSAGGRIFYIMDEGPRESILLPAKWMLIARDAFNGQILWKRPIAEWNTSLWPLKSGPNQLPRRLVAAGDRVYVTLGIDAPLVALDAATGKTLRTYAGTEHTDEILLADGMLFLLAAHGPNKWKEYRPKFTYVWSNSQRANKDWAWDQEERSVLAVRADSGDVLWKKASRVAPLTLAVDAARVYFHDGAKAVALDRKTGDAAWASEPITRKGPALPTGYGPTLVVKDDVVVISMENASMAALAAATGKKLWSAPHHKGGHNSPDDLLVINGTVWSGAVANGGDSGVFTGRDLRTGKITSEFPPDVKAYWFHHRCYRSKATERFIMTSRTGIEFIDPTAKHWEINHWVRGGCLYGIMPANGMIYVPPQACGCYLESKLFGFTALAPASASRQVPRDVPEAERLERGPAYAGFEDRGSGAQTTGLQTPASGLQAPASGSQTPAAGLPAAPSPEDWPTYRHDAARSGCVATTVPAAGLKRTWQADLGGRLSSMVAAGDKVFLASIDTHRVLALETATGRTAWTFTAGGRVDSPPTIYQGRAIFGSADGWIYCLRADDGQLAWRFRAAPADRRIMAFEQLESAWPVSGSVLVQNGAVYAVAGRSAFLDGGLRLVRLDPRTGRLTAEARIDDRDPETGGDLQMLMQGLDMPVALPDILSSDGKHIYMRAQPFDLDGKRLGAAPVKSDEARPHEAHLFSRSGFLDDSWYFRSYWLYGRGVDSGYGGWFRAGHVAPSGRLMVFDQASVYGFDRKPEYLCNASAQEYYLYAAAREVSSAGVRRVAAASRQIDAASKNRSASSSDWGVRAKFSLADQSAASYQWAAGGPPIQARAMALAGGVLLVAGPPDVVDEDEAFRAPDDPAIRTRLEEQAAALAGRKGGMLLAFSAADGKPLAACDLGAMPVFDGMAAARGRVFLTTTDGRVLCLGAEGTALPPAPAAKLVPLDTTARAASAEPEPPAAAPAGKAAAGGGAAAGDFDKVAAATVTKSDLGYTLRGREGKGVGLGLAVKKLPTPLAGKVAFKVRMQLTADGALKNGFLVFGDGSADASLIKCGLRLIQKKAVIVEGPLTGGKTAEAALEIDVAKPYDLDVTVDLAAGQVTMKVGGATVAATLERKIEKITHVGYGAAGAVTHFGAVEATGN